jgi:hypothetical protein
MATHASHGAIDKLPAEILELFMLEVIGYDKTRIGNYQNNPDRKIYCWNPRVGLLTFRTTSKAFHCTLWRAIAKVIGTRCSIWLQRLA